MIITMPIVLMMQVTIDEIVDMISVRHCGMSTPWAMDMIRVMTGTLVPLGTGIRVLLADLDNVLIDVIAMGVVQMSIVQVVNVVSVLDGNVTAVGSMNVIVVGMDFAVAHRFTHISGVRRPGNQTTLLATFAC